MIVIDGEAQVLCASRQEAETLLSKLLCSGSALKIVQQNESNLDREWHYDAARLEWIEQ